MTKIGIVLTVRNCLDLTQAAIASIFTKHPSVLCVLDDHSDQAMKDWLTAQPDLHAIIDPPTSGLAANWNLGAKWAIDQGCTHILILNNDLLLHPETINNLVDRLDKGDVVMATGVNVAGACPTPQDIFSLSVGEASETEHPDFSCFMLTPRTIEKIGWFDENYIGAYVEDCDYHARMALAGEKAVTINQAPYYHYASMTLKANPQLVGLMSENHAKNVGYFHRKWGTHMVGDAPIMREVYYKTPFNDPNKTIKDW